MLECPTNLWKPFILFFVSAVLLLSSHAEAKTSFEGVAFLAAHSEKAPCKRMLKALRPLQNPAIQTLWGTFGSSMKCLNRFTYQFRDRPHLVAVNLLNGSCIRRGGDRFCYQGEPFKVNATQFNRLMQRMRPKTVRTLSRRTSRVRKRFERIMTDNTKLRLHPVLEDDLTNRAFRNLVGVVKNEWPYQIFRSANSQNRKLGGASGIELHNFGVFGALSAFPKASWSNDGISISGCSSGTSGGFQASADASQVRGAVTSARAIGSDVFLWCAGWQGLTDNFRAPRERVMAFQRSDIFLIRNLLRE